MIYTYGVVERQLSLRVVDASVGRHTEALWSASRWYCCMACLVPNPSFQKPAQQRIALQVQLCIVRYLSVHVSLTEHCMQSESFTQAPQMGRIGKHMVWSQQPIQVHSGGPHTLPTWTMVQLVNPHRGNFQFCMKLPKYQAHFKMRLRPL